MQGPSSESFWASKTMCMLVVCILAVILLIAVGVAVKVIFDEDVFTLIAAGIASITGQAGAGTWRNVQTDAPIRQQYAQAQTTGKLSDPPI